MKMSPQIKFALACATVVLTAEVLASATATLNWRFGLQARIHLPILS